MILEVRKNVWINNFETAEIAEISKLQAREYIEQEQKIKTLEQSSKKTDNLEAERLKHILNETYFKIKFTLTSGQIVFSNEYETLEKANKAFKDMIIRDLYKK